MTEHWTETLFIEYAHLFLKVLERAVPKAEAEVEVLVKIFSEFGVAPPSRILDLCCGIGRHSLALAQRGFNVVGVDVSPLYVDRARRLAKTRNVEGRTRFLLGDATKVLELLGGDRGSFDAAVSMFSSLGYYDEEADRLTLMQLLELVKQGGLLVVDVANRDWILKHFAPVAVEELTDELQLHEHRSFNLETSRVENLWKFYSKQGEDLKCLASIPVENRVYSLHELVCLLEQAGWGYVKAYGSFGLEPVSTETRRIIAVAAKM